MKFTSNEYVNFKHLLEYFVAHLEFVDTNDSNAIKGGTYKTNTRGFNQYIAPLLQANSFKSTGQAYKNAMIQQQIDSWSDYNKHKVLISIQHSRAGGYRTFANYLHWNNEDGWMTICADWDGNNIDSLFLSHNTQLDRTKPHIKTFDINKLGLFDGKSPNKEVEDLLDTFYDEEINNIKGIIPSPPSPVKPQNIPLNQILYGPPGTGKTYHTVDKSLEILNPSLLSSPRKDQKDEFDRLKAAGRIIFTTFHQSMSYEDFIEGIKPETDSKTKQVEYPVKDGIFKKLCTEAINHPDQNYVLIIDEINRGNVSQIFGELITLLEADKRIGNDFGLTVKLPYSNQKNDFGVPSNLYIIGTMNTADRSVEALDTALRRRFSFEEMMPNPSLLNTVTIHGLSVGLEDLLNVINQRIVLLKDREHQIGHSYFMKCKDLADLKAVFKDNIVPLLQEYFYGNYYNIGLVLGEEFVKKENPVGKFGKGFDYDGDAEPGWRMLSDDEWDRLDMNVAITALMN